MYWAGAGERGRPGDRKRCVAMDFGEVLGTAVKIDTLVHEAIAKGGAEVPVELRVHSHGWTVTFDGTAVATKDGVSVRDLPHDK